MNAVCLQCPSRLRGFFAALDGEQLKELGSQHRPRLYSRGEQIFRAGQEPFGFYCIHYGSVKIYKTGPDGHRLIVGLASAGELLGYAALLSGEPYTVTAEAMDDCCLCLLPKEFILSLLQTQPKFSLQMIQILSRELREKEDRLTSMAQKRVRERLAEIILLLRQTHGIDDRNGVLINLQLRREELAAIVGTTTESIVRELKELRRRQIIQVRHRRIRILNLPDLIQTANR